MKIATILFTYNRIWHTKQVLDALKENTILPEKLFLFQDGLKDERHREEWSKVNNLIKAVDWCENEVIVSPVNKGVAESIINGVNSVFKQCDAVIVLEDDCIPDKLFLEFMYQCFAKYEQEKKVHSVSGYAWPIELPENDTEDIYGCGRISSWGWGTWKDRWTTYQRNMDMLKKIKADASMSKELATWGMDLEQMLLNNISGLNDSWAVYWALNAIYHQQLCINPYRSLIQNIGLDGSGVHCGAEKRFSSVKVNAEKELKRHFRLPDKIQIYESTREEFTNLYGNYTAVTTDRKGKEKILVYGLGSFFSQNEKELNHEFQILAFIDGRKTGCFAGKEIVKVHKINEFQFDKVILMIQDIQECIRVAQNLIETYQVCYENIILGHALYGKYSQIFDEIKITEDGKIRVCRNDISLKVGSLDEFNNVYEVLVDETYHYFINNVKKDIVFDVGMNIGDASLYFLKNQRVKKVFAYEPFADTFCCAKENLQEYLKSADRIEVYPFGISDRNEERQIKYNKGMSCGQSTINTVRETAFQFYSNRKLIKPEDEREEWIKVFDAAEIFSPILKKYSDCNFILKMDVEGEEYGIIQRLSDKGLLNKFAVIMLEWHYQGKDRILQYLRKDGFSYWCSNKSEEMGLIYAYK